MSLFQNEFDNARIQLDEKIDYDVAQLLQKSKATVSIAESITSGHILSRFSSLPNYDLFLHGGVVCQHPRSFMTFCGVSPTDLSSALLKPQELASLMLDQIYMQTKSSICISSAGHIEKKQNDELSAKVFLGFRVHDEKKIKALELIGKKTTLFKQAAQAALAFLRHQINTKEHHYG